MSGFYIPSSLLCICAGVCVFAFGIITIAVAGRIVDDFKLVITAHRRILFMALLFKGLALCSIGTIIGSVAIINPTHPVSKIVLALCAVTLILFGIVTGSLGGRSDFMLFKISPIVFLASAMLILAGIAHH
jgi:hypothetical protein